MGSAAQTTEHASATAGTLVLAARRSAQIWTLEMQHASFVVGMEFVKQARVSASTGTTTRRARASGPVVSATSAATTAFFKQMGHAHARMATAERHAPPHAPL